MNRKALVVIDIQNDLTKHYMGMKYQYRRLDNNNFTGHSLDDFIRRQTVTECWRKIDNDWKLVPNELTPL